MNKFFILLRYLFILSILLPFSTLAQDGQTLDKIVAIVDGEIILDSEVGGLVYSVLQNQQANPTMEELESFWYQALNELIDQKTMLAHAKRDTTIKIEEAMVTQRLDQQVEGLIAQAGGEYELETQFGKSILQIKADYRDLVRDQLYIAQFRERKVSGIKITPSEVKHWFNKIPEASMQEIPEIVRVAHVVRLPIIPEESKEEARQIASTLRDSILAGSPIEEIAKRYSDEPSAKQTGGAGRFNVEQLDPDFVAVASTIPPGGISQVFETQFGMHVMRVNSLQGNILDYNHVLIQIDDSKADPSNAKNTLSMLRDSILVNKVPFQDIAKRHSEDKQSANIGGYVMNYNTGDRDLFFSELSPRWRLTLNGLEVDEISEPVETDLRDGRKAWHIVWLQKRIPAHKLNYEDDYSRIEQVALQEKQYRELSNWLGALRSEIYIKILVDENKLEASRNT